MAEKKTPVVLCIIDGWGHSTDEENNGIAQGKTPCYDKMMKNCAEKGTLSFLEASGKFVGLPDNLIGNSETGHMNIGAGRVVYQDICRIDHEIETKVMEKDENILNLIESHQKGRGKVHLMGLTSPGGVHSHERHLLYVANLLAEKEVIVCLHVFTDGRDVPPQGAKESLPSFLEKLDKRVRVITLSGRYFAMDRDKRWERTISAFEAIRFGEKEEKKKRFKNVLLALEESYKRGKTDEFVEPSVVEGYEGMENGDSLLMMNFRNDRARQILHSFVDKDIISKNKLDVPHFKHKIGLVPYSSELDLHFKSIIVKKPMVNVLGEVIAKNGKNQFRIAETEKYAHVTFFLNGGQEKTFPNEKRALIPSPKVATYDLKPEMASFEMTEELCKNIESQEFDFVVVNYAAPDMVGHTGKLEAAIKACEAVDKCLGELEKSVQKVGGVCLITADHGNCEKMWNEEKKVNHTAHTLNRVPLLAIGNSKFLDGIKLQDGSLCDVAPTVLELMGLKQPEEMTGKSLIVTSFS